jgi:phage-related protein
LQIEIGKGLLPVVQAILPPLKAFAAWAVENPRAFKIVAGTIAGIATAILAVNFAMAANPFTLIALGIAALVTGLAVAYTKFEQFRNIVNTVLKRSYWRF